MIRLTSAPGSLETGAGPHEGLESIERGLRARHIVEQAGLEDPEPAVCAAEDMLPCSTLRGAIVTRIPRLRVAREADCAALGLSGANPVEPPTAPLVYVDGLPATGTCTLLQLPVFSIQRVEIYSMGGASYSRLPRSPNGMILIYTKRS